MPPLLPHVLWGRSQVSLFFASVVSPDNVISSTPHLGGIRTHNIRGDGHWLIGSYISNYHTITTAPKSYRYN
jgi:hypothetical protein